MLHKMLRSSDGEGAVLNKSFMQLLAACRRGDGRNVEAGEQGEGGEVPSSRHSTASIVRNLQQRQVFALVLHKTGCLNSQSWVGSDPGWLMGPYALTAEL